MIRHDVRTQADELVELGPAAGMVVRVRRNAAGSGVVVEVGRSGESRTAVQLEGLTARRPRKVTK